MGIGFEHGHQIGIPRVLSDFDDVDLVGLADTSPEMLAKGKEAFPDARAYEDPILALDELGPGMVALASLRSRQETTSTLTVLV